MDDFQDPPDRRWVTNRPRQRWVSFLLVGLQFGLCTAIVALAPWQCLSFKNGLFGPILIMLGSALAVWAWLSIGLTKLRIMPDPGATAALVMHGPYARIRHPMYAGLLVGMLGVACLNIGWIQCTLWLILLLVLQRKAVREEHFLQNMFSDYVKYQQRTGRFFPRIRRRLE